MIIGESGIMSKKMNLKQAINYMEAEKETWHIPNECDLCNKEYKISYSFGDDPYNIHSLCGRCLVKAANNYRNWVDTGGGEL